MKIQIIITFVCFMLSMAVTTAQTVQTKNNKTMMELTYAGIKGGNIPRKQFLSDSIIHVDNGDAIDHYRYKIISFKVSIIQKGGAPVLDIPSDGNKMPQRAKDLIKDLPTGSKIFIEYMRAKIDEDHEINNTIVKPSNNSPRALEPMAFTIVDE